MTTAHHIELPKAIWGIKIAQLAIATIVFALACYEIAIITTGMAGFIIFAVSILGTPSAYNRH
jgi:hypothetical protein